MEKETTIEPTERYRSKAVFVPTMIEAILKTADETNTYIEVDRMHTPFGTYVLDVRNTTVKTKGN